MCIGGWVCEQGWAVSALISPRLCGWEQHRDPAPTPSHREPGLTVRAPLPPLQGRSKEWNTCLKIYAGIFMWIECVGEAACVCKRETQKMWENGPNTHTHSVPYEHLKGHSKSSLSYTYIHIPVYRESVRGSQAVLSCCIYTHWHI